MNDDKKTTQSGKPASNIRFIGKMQVRMVALVVTVLVVTAVILIVTAYLLSQSTSLEKLITGQSEMSTLLGGMLAFTVIGIVVASVLCSFYLRSLKDLKDAMQKVAEGDFDVKLKVNPKTEVGTLCYDFNKMVADLKKLETFKDEFIVNASHEFKTPLSTIKGYASLISEGSLTEEEVKQYAEYIMDASARLSTLTGNILKLSKLDTQEIIFEQKVFNPAEQIREVILALEKKWTVKNLDFDIDMDEVKISGNPDLIQQVWQNLIDNAVKFSNKDGKITVSLKSDGDRIKVLIADNGIGMDAETILHAFDKFYQGDTSRSKDGNGLGLALVKRIIEISGGTITLSSQKDEGTAFTLYLPVKSETAQYQK